MSNPLVNFASPIHGTVDYLTPKMDPTKVAAFYPKSSTAAPAVPFLQVGWDGTPVVEYPVTQRATVRLTGWATTPDAAVDLFAKAQGYMLTHPGDGLIWAVQALTGGLPTRDPDTQLYLCSGTFRVSVRPLTAA